MKDQVWENLHSRRHLIYSLGAVSALRFFSSQPMAQSQSSNYDPALGQKLMGRCLELATQAAQAKQYALGALVVRKEKILAETGSQLQSSYDPTAHPELV